MTTTYEAHLTRTEGWWAVEIKGLPDNMFAVTQGRNLRESRHMARDAIAVLLDVPIESIEVELVFPDLMDALRRSVEEARARRKAASAAEQDAVREAALRLVDQGLTVHDAGRLLGLSGQRVSQLTAGAIRRRRKRPAA